MPQGGGMQCNVKAPDVASCQQYCDHESKDENKPTGHSCKRGFSCKYKATCWEGYTCQCLLRYACNDAMPGNRNINFEEANRTVEEVVEVPRIQPVENSGATMIKR